MTLKIETASDGHTTSLRLIGRIEAEYLDELEAHVRRHEPLLVLDLDEVTPGGRRGRPLPHRV